MLDFSYVLAWAALMLAGLAAGAWLTRPPLQQVRLSRRNPPPVRTPSQAAGVLLLLSLGASALAAATAVVRLFVG